MAQYLKQDVRDRILDAAVRSFAESGYAAATMRQIAKAAGLSSGNVYRYFGGKEDLFAAALPADFLATFESLVRQRVRSLRGVRDVTSLAPNADFHLVSEELLRFCIEHRLRVVVLLNKSSGSVHASFGARMVQQLVNMAVEHARSIGHDCRLSTPERFALEQIYRNFVVAMVQILTNYDDEARIRSSLRRFERYHLAGLKSFFEGDAP
jgi:AcrR family transcriptional regulator